ncbi:MAG TPA: proton-conducting transporter membrane subunit [Verrucomicrobiae bacterium]|nr:proton-conducting transporter membrane subunit [Verrucomicrobiae bacterium]
MSVWLVILGIVCHAVSGVPGLFVKRHSAAGQNIAAGLGLVGSVAGVAGALWSVWVPTLPTPAIKIDGISVMFLLPIFVIPALGGVYGLEYWKQADHPQNGRKLCFFYGLVTAALAAITIAANAIEFLVVWEIMALGAFFLITTEDEDPAVREAGWVYVVAAHMATLGLFALFALMHSVTGTFALVALPDNIASGVAAAIFLLAVVAFGLKAGVMPFHVWLPGAHAKAPSHVSAMMSGVLIKIGIYGLVRIGSLLPHPPLWWGGVLLAAGTISGILGVVFALGQHDLKRLLAYHSIENIGIIVMGLGLALMGRSLQRADWVVLGLAGALLHVWNHSLFKSLLFLGAGAVVHATHTLEIDDLGGLAKSMPRTALCFAVGAVAICGLPPLNGFVSELLIYLGLFRSLGIGAETPWAGVAFAAPALAMIGALAVACFVKAFGTVFLGVARSHHARHAHEPPPTMTGPMFALAGCCLFIGLAPLAVAPIMEQAVAAWDPQLAAGGPGLSALAPLGWVTVCGLALAGLLALGSAALAEMVHRGGTASAGTWDCGYAAPGPRVQYTSSSFAQMLVGLFAWVLRPRVETPGELSLFPGEARFRSEVPDIVLDGAMRPGFRFGARITSSFRFLQAGSVHAYLLYIVLFLILLLLWR